MRISCELLEVRTLFAGVTILTHGQSGNITGWIAAAADAIQQRLGGTSAASNYSLTVDDVGNGAEVTEFKLVSGNKPLDQTTAGEAIIKLDWSDVSHGTVTTQEVARLAADYLLSAHKGVPDFTQLPFHLVGHSRGASLITALAGDLGERGIWVDQATNLDPHPVTGDVGMETHANVIFSDTYYQIDESTKLDPDGQPVDGSHNLNLKDSVGRRAWAIRAHCGDGVLSRHDRFQCRPTTTMRRSSARGMTTRRPSPLAIRLDSPIHSSADWLAPPMAWARHLVEAPVDLRRSSFPGRSGEMSSIHAS